MNRQRGAIYVEALVMIPVLVTLWVIVLFIERGNSVDNETVERSRYCAWRFATDECEGTPPGCDIEGPSRIDALELDGASSGGLTDLAQVFPFLGREFGDAHGRVFRATSHDRLARPFGWGSIDVESHQTWMCQTPKGIWRTPLVFAATCTWHGLDYCDVAGEALGAALDLPGWAQYLLGLAGLPESVIQDLAGLSGILDLANETVITPIRGTARGRLDAWRATQPR